jgi:hypothetical protein
MLGVVNILTIIGLLIYVFVVVLIIALIISCLIRLSRFLKTAGNEQKLTRLEIGKLAEEVKNISKKLDK